MLKQWINELYIIYTLKNSALSVGLKPSWQTVPVPVHPPALPVPSSSLSLPVEGDDGGNTRLVTGGKLTLWPGDIGHQENIREWQGRH